jgi:hypothetical protein
MELPILAELDGMITVEVGRQGQKSNRTEGEVEKSLLPEK